MKRIIHSNATQCQFDFDSLAILPVPANAEIGLTITPLPELAQEQHWWSELEYQYIPDSPGIYCIVNMTNRHFYVGSAVDLQNRKRQHFQSLQRGDHHSAYLQRAYSKYGPNVFRFAIVERIDQAESLIEREQHYIDNLSPEYNIAPTAGSTLGVKHTEGARKNMSEAHKGQTLSPASIEKRAETMSEKRKADPTYGTTKGKPAHNKGKPMSPESIAKREATKKARREAGEYAPVVSPFKGKKRGPISEEQKANMRKPKSEGHKANLSKAMKGKPNGRLGKHHSEETKKKIGEANKGKSSPNKGNPRSEETKARISEALKGNNKGEPWSPETIAKREATKRAKRAIDPIYGTKKAK